jgi:hypothetical protein
MFSNSISRLNMKESKIQCRIELSSHEINFLIKCVGFNLIIVIDGNPDINLINRILTL